MNRTDLQQLATTRLAEAKALLAAGHPSGTYYLAGYALECAFKACIAGKTKADDFPDRERVNAAYVHSAEKLCKVADLDKQLQIDGNLNPQLLHFWTICKDWSEQSRYIFIHRSERKTSSPPSKISKPEYCNG